MSKPAEELHTSRMALWTRLDNVTNFDTIPTENEINALVHEIHMLTGLLSRLAALLAFEEHVEARFLIETIRESLIRLHLEVQLLRRECQTDVSLSGEGFFRWHGRNWLRQGSMKRVLPTRSLLEQQLLVRKQGEFVLDYLDALSSSLRSLSASSSGKDEDKHSV